ncbi:transcription repressor NadR [Halobacillus sp. A5]|uniref:transcription repressor NadR n=1 Tax=Halobacillus sp. A5 TaxID=2880263 RepID=UPI0020A67A3D|nr:transcription repressor NadR [Halobacillus sp. A5]MCP3027453.1 transcription repressor NadR [Halobacillus sp. A5]
MHYSKLKAEERRENILSYLKQSKEPIKGHSLANTMNVTRQVIVGDISLLKAGGEPIVATSQGYVYMSHANNQFAYREIIVCQHRPDQTEEELTILVDHGVHVIDVIVEHPVYGDLTASLGISNRRDVARLIEQLDQTGAQYLAQLTGGLHTHTIAAHQRDALEEAKIALARKGILVEP